MKSYLLLILSIAVLISCSKSNVPNPARDPFSKQNVAGSLADSLASLHKVRVLSDFRSVMYANSTDSTYYIHLGYAGTTTGEEIPLEEYAKDVLDVLTLYMRRFYWAPKDNIFIEMEYKDEQAVLSLDECIRADLMAKGGQEEKLKRFIEEHFLPRT